MARARTSGEVAKPKRVKEAEQAEALNGAEPISDDCLRKAGASEAADEPAPEADAPTENDAPAEPSTEQAPADEAAPETVPQFEATELIGALGDFLLAEMKAARNILKPWTQLTEGEQAFHCNRAATRAREIVLAVAQATASRGFESVSMRVESRTVKDELKVVLTAPESAEALFVGKPRLVQLVFADLEEFAGAMKERPAPNQPDLLASAEPKPEDDDSDGEAEDEEHDPETGELTPTPPIEAPAEQPPAVAA